SAGVGYLDTKVLWELLPVLHLQDHPIAGCIQLPPGPFVDRKSGVEEIAPVRREPLRAVKGAGGFLAAGQGQLDRAQRTIFLGAVSNQRVDPYGGFGLVVDAATRIKVAVLLDQLERIARPVLALRLDNIDMGKQQNRFELWITTGVGGEQPAFL